MSRFELDVPYADRRQVRRLGARWDAERRCWFVPAEADPLPFLGWCRASSSVNVRAHGAILLETDVQCGCCARLTRAFGVVLPAGHAIRLDSDEGEQWELSDEPTLLSWITSLAPPIEAWLRQRTLFYRPRHAYGDSTAYWYNHCEYCAARLDEHTLFHTPGLAFDPLDTVSASAIRCLPMPGGFAGSADHFSYGVCFLEEMAHIG